MSFFLQKNQKFKTFDMLMVFGLVGLVATLSGVVLARSFEDERPNRAWTSAEALAMQMAAQSGSSIVDHPSDDRAPASVGEEAATIAGDIARDPWGRPFHYLVLRGGGHKRVVVWSDGANRLAESMESIRKNLLALPIADSIGKKHSALFHGDDIGFVRDE